MENEIRKRIIELSDEKYKEFHSKLCPNISNIVGVRVPILRNYAKELSKGEFRKYLNNSQDKYYEETLLQGMIIGIAKMDINERLQYLTNFIPKIDNWATCDITCTGLKFTNKNKEIVWEFLQKYINSQNEFELRFSIVMLLSFYITDEYIEKVLQILNQIQHEGYYVKMAIAWAVSIAYIKFPKKTMDFLNKNNLDDFTYNKSLQKIIESNRVTIEDKNIVRNMKR